MTERNTATTTTRPLLALLSSLVAIGMVAGCQAKGDDDQAAAPAVDQTTSAAPIVDAAPPSAVPTTSAPTDVSADSSVPAATPSATPTTDPAEGPAVSNALKAAASWWMPVNPTSWQYAIGDSKLDTTVKAAIYTTDGDGTTAAQVRTLHAAGRHVVCYVDAGTWENWRADAARFPAAVKGKDMDDWPGEKWLDIRKSATLLPLIEARVKTCADKGFDAVEFDNVDGYANDTGFPLTAADQLAYNRALATIAHAHRLAAGLKNDVDQISALQPNFDFAVNESCLEYRECSAYAPFVKAGKVVLHVEYRNSANFCADRSIVGFTSIAKREDLGAWRASCG